MVNPDDFVITRKRKKYKFAHFSNYENCFEVADISENFVKKWQADRELTLEIGAGTALFALQLAIKHPEKCFIAVDVKADRLWVGAKQALEKGVGNILFVRAHVNQLEQFLPKSSVTSLWLTFSDPFPKKRHAKHRLTHKNFLKIYKLLLKRGGQLLQKTDNHDLFDWSLEQVVTDKWLITRLTYDLHSSDLPSDYKIMTTYEERFIQQGLTVYCMTATVS